MVHFYLGCAGWSYGDWKKGGFYPENLPESDYLQHYAKFMNVVEINSSFYSIPSENTVNHWVTSTPEGFRFTAKFLKTITHEKLMESWKNQISEFIHRFLPMKNKLWGLIFQYPPSMKYSEGKLNELRKIQDFVMNKTDSLEFPLLNCIWEFRHPSWYASAQITSILDNIVQNSKQIFCYPFLDTLVLPPVMEFIENVRNSSIYIRAIGNRNITKFDRIRNPRKEEFLRLLNQLQQLKERPNIEDIFVIFNNHYRGFSPQDVAETAHKLGIRMKSFTSQKKLGEFFHQQG